MASVNKVIIVGNLGRDPEIRHTQSGAAVANFSIATNESWNKDGQKEERTEWHRVVAFGKLGDICGQYLKKGKQVYIEGRLQTRNWDDRDGNKRSVTEIVATNMVMLGGRGDGEVSAYVSAQDQGYAPPISQAQRDAQETFGVTPTMEKDVPF